LIENFSFSHRLQNETKILMQQTNDALQELNNTRVLTEADQVRRKKRKSNLILSFFRDEKKL
jgi:hypothetical protein